MMSDYPGSVVWRHVFVKKVNLCTFFNNYLSQIESGEHRSNVRLLLTLSPQIVTVVAAIVVVGGSTSSSSIVIAAHFTRINE